MLVRYREPMARAIAKIDALVLSLSFLDSRSRAGTRRIGRIPARLIRPVDGGFVSLTHMCVGLAKNHRITRRLGAHARPARCAASGRPVRY